MWQHFGYIIGGYIRRQQKLNLHSQNFLIRLKIWGIVNSEFTVYFDPKLNNLIMTCIYICVINKHQCGNTLDFRAVPLQFKLLKNGLHQVLKALLWFCTVLCGQVTGSVMHNAPVLQKERAGWHEPQACALRVILSETGIRDWKCLYGRGSDYGLAYTAPLVMSIISFQMSSFGSESSNWRVYMYHFYSD